jgi:PX domain
VCQKYKAFCQLHASLIGMYPNIKYPASSSIFHVKSFVDLKNIHHSSERSSHSFIEDRRKLLQVYLQELALIPSIKDCPAFKQFLNLDEQFPELKEEEVT